MEDKSRSGFAKWLKRTEVRFFALGAVSALAFIGIYVYAFNGMLPGSGRTYEYYKGLDESYGKYYQMQELIEDQALFSYQYDGVDDKKFATEIMSGLKDDKYAEYYTAEEYSEYRKRYFSFVGVGLSMTMEDGRLTVARVINDSSAGEAGVKAGDIIVSVNGRKIESAKEAEKAFAGKTGDSFKVEAERDGKKMTFDLELRKIEEETVIYGVVDRDNSIGYIQITSFAKDTCTDFAGAVQALEDKGCDKLILDLRNNTGGREYDGLKVADQLLPECTIITEKQAGGREKVRTSDKKCIDMKYVLLVNEYTASSSEIVTSAVKANKGGTIIGTVTYGKGLIQRLHEFEDGSACKYTIGEYYAADGSRIQGTGIKPDIEAEGDEAIREAVRVLVR